MCAPVDIGWKSLDKLEDDAPPPYTPMMVEKIRVVQWGVRGDTRCSQDYWSWVRRFIRASICGIGEHGKSTPGTFGSGVEGMKGAYNGEEGLVEGKAADISTQRFLLLY